jgi:REP element-mobilizing transposase RayT
MSRKDDWLFWAGVRMRSRGRLPHWEVTDGVYAATFRLGDSLPQAVLLSYERERIGIVETARQLGRPLSESERTRLKELFDEHIEKALDAGYGSCILQERQIGQMVYESLGHFAAGDVQADVVNDEVATSQTRRAGDDVRYVLLARCVMSNHVHVVFQPLRGYGLDSILHSWKSYTAKKINKALGQSGHVWQREYYDHLIRDEAELSATLQYVLNNPKKAGLRDWSWVEASA